MNRRWVVWSVLALSLVGLWWAILHFSGQLLEARLRSTINDRPDRAYDFKFGKLVVQAGFSGVELLDITITPRFADSLDLSVLGELDRASIQGLKWYALMVEGQLILESIEFKRPHFRVYRRAKPTDMRSDIAVSDRSEPAQKRGLQSVFTDLLKRGELSDFLVSEAYAAYYLIDRDTVEFARVFGLHLHATGIETDRMHWDSPVPFELNRFRLKIDSIRAQPSGNTELQTGAIDYDSEHNKLSLRSVKWQHTRNWVEISREMGEQKDLFELELDALDITGIRALNRIFEDLEVDAHKLSLTGMRFFDYKNKNLPLKKKEYKPMFHGMLRRIPVPLQLDTVEIRNSRIEYREIAEHYAKPGLIVFDNFEAEVYHLSNLKTYQREHRQLVAYLRTRFNGSGALKARLEVPYRGERFHLEAEMGPMPLSALNTTLEPLAGVRIKEGKVHRLKLDMKADSTVSTNKFWLDYEDIDFQILDREEDEWHPKDKALLGLLAGVFVNKTNLPGDKHYRNAEYTAPRTLHKSPFNFMWTSVKEGCMYILPGSVARSFLKHQRSELTKEPKKKKS